MATDLPGVYYRADRGWSPDVRALVGSQFYGDETMASWALDGIGEDRMRPVALQLAGLVAVLLAHGPWGDGCTTPAELRDQWAESTVALVAELEAAAANGGAPPEGDDGDAGP